MSSPPPKPPKPPLKPPKPGRPSSSESLQIQPHSISTKEASTKPSSSNESESKLKPPTPPPPPSKPAEASSVCVRNEEVQDDILHKGLLSKRNREGKFEKCIFTLYKDHISYHRIASTGTAEVDDSGKSIPLNSVVIRYVRAIL